MSGWSVDEICTRIVEVTEENGYNIADVVLALELVRHRYIQSIWDHTDTLGEHVPTRVN
jgi:hypothetical protein